MNRWKDCPSCMGSGRIVNVHRVEGDNAPFHLPCLTCQEHFRAVDEAVEKRWARDVNLVEELVRDWPASSARSELIAGSLVDLADKVVRPYRDRGVLLARVLGACENWRQLYEVGGIKHQYEIDLYEALQSLINAKNT